MIRIVSLYLCLTLVHSAIAQQSRQAWTPLFDGRSLAGWDTYLDREIDSMGKPLSTQPLGLNNDPRHVFTVVREDGQPAIRVSGKIWGGLASKKEFSNYHLQLQFKWGKAMPFGPKRGQKKDSGLLYHSTGSYAASSEPWLRSHEFQIEEGNTGAYWGVSGAGAEIKAVLTPDGKEYRYDPTGTLTKFSQSGKAGRHCEKSADEERPSGEWNTVDLYCFNGTSVHVVNGKVVMVLFNSFQEDKSAEAPLIQGKVQLQSEGAELFYRDIRLMPINGIPENLL